MVGNNPGCLFMAKETLVHHCSFLATHRENCNVLACLRQSRGQLAHLKARLAHEPRLFYSGQDRSGSFTPEFYGLIGETAHE